MKKLPFTWLYPLLTATFVLFTFLYPVFRHRVSILLLMGDWVYVFLLILAYLLCGINQNTFRFERGRLYIRNPMLPFLNKTILLGDIEKIVYRNVTGKTLTPAIEVKLKSGREISRFYQGSSKKVRLFLQHLSEATGINYEEET